MTDISVGQNYIRYENCKKRKKIVKVKQFTYSELVKHHICKGKIVCSSIRIDVCVAFYSHSTVDLNFVQEKQKENRGD